MKIETQEIQNNCYRYILEHLDEIIVNADGNIDNIKTNIKIYTYNYLIESNYIYFEEGFIKNVSDTAKSVFWSNAVNAWTGKVSMSNWLAGVGVKSLSTGFKATNFASSGVSEFVKKFGLPATLNTLILRAAFVSIFPTVLLGMTIHSLIRHKDILLLKNFERYLLACIESIKLNNKKDFKNVYKNINKQYAIILKDKCSKISDNNNKLKCASSNYMKYITEIILKELIIEYVIFIKKQNFDISYMTSIDELFKFNFNKSSIISTRFIEMYKSYIECLKIYTFDGSYNKHISFLNNEVKKNVKN